MKQRHARHVGILLQLRSRLWVSATDLSLRFGVDVRTIYLDIDMLTAAGLPIEMVPGRAGAYRLGHAAPANADEPLDRYLLGARAREQLRHLGQRAYARQQRLVLHRLTASDEHPDEHPGEHPDERWSGSDEQQSGISR